MIDNLYRESSVSLSIRYFNIGECLALTHFDIFRHSNGYLSRSLIFYILVLSFISRLVFNFEDILWLFSALRFSIDMMSICCSLYSGWVCDLSKECDVEPF